MNHQPPITPEGPALGGVNHGGSQWNREAILSHDAHGAVLRRFGRYPHRNVQLGRESTPEEMEIGIVIGIVTDSYG